MHGHLEIMVRQNTKNYKNTTIQTCGHFSAIQPVVIIAGQLVKQLQLLQVSHQMLLQLPLCSMCIGVGRA